ncbi:hypothetical protein ACQ4LE_001893 [Meloidogyne hapla]|uniref:Nodal modulator 1 n=1 Tax=Meloidogyne hapla TaxID=6305 RepID=A0A1I8BNW5_MELHA
MFFYLLNCYLFLLPFVAHTISGKVISCEGNVNSDIYLDFSLIKINLYTLKGDLKYVTDCNPKNGNFLIPIYIDGEYLIKIIAPDGYFFDPELHKIEVIGQNGCSKELNFNLFGLKISGKVLNGQDSSLDLQLSNQDGKLIERTVVDENGNYNFITKPGKYEISPISGSAQCLSQSSVKLEVGTVPMKIKPDIRIEGHSLTVKVKDEEGESFQGATVILQSDKEIKSENLPITSERPQPHNEGQKWFYEFKTNYSGSTLINCLPPGKYILNAIANKQKVFSLIEPLFNNIDPLFGERIVEVNSKTPEVTIYVNYFNLFGNVFTAKGSPLGHVTIKLDGEFKTISDEGGKFILTNVSPGSHVIKAEKEHFEFNRLHLHVSTKMIGQIKFSPNRISICGQILLAEEIDGISFQISYLPDNLHSLLSTNFEGKFCSMFKPGRYKIKPISSMFLYPNQIELVLNEGPILDLKFIQQKNTSITTETRQTSMHEAMMNVLTIVSSWGSIVQTWMAFFGAVMAILGLLVCVSIFLYQTINEMRSGISRIETEQTQMRNGQTQMRTQMRNDRIQLRALRNGQDQMRTEMNSMRTRMRNDRIQLRALRNGQDQMRTQMRDDMLRVSNAIQSLQK